MSRYYKGKDMSEKDQKDLESLIKSIDGFSHEVRRISATRLRKVANKPRRNENGCK